MPSTPTDRLQGLTTSVAVKAPCKAVTTTAITLNGEQTVGGTACVSGDRVLVAISGGSVNNGIWTVDTGDWSRAKDFDGNRDVVAGTMVIVALGGSARLWQVVTDDPIVIGATSIEFAAIDPASPSNGSFDPLVNYTFGSLGAWLQDQAVNVMAFCASEAQRAAIKAGTSADDHTSIFVAAYTWAAGRPLYLPAGRWNISAVTLAAASQTVFGDGWKTIIRQISPTVNLLTVTASNVTLRDMQLEGAATSEANTTFAVFTATATAANYLRVINVNITGPSAGVGFNNGIKFDDNCNHGVVTLCSFSRLWGTSAGRGYGVLFGAANNLTITYNTWAGAPNRGRHAFYGSAGATGCRVQFNDVTGAQFEGITFNSLGAQPPNAYNLIDSNVLDGCCTAIPGITTGQISIFGHANRNKISRNFIKNGKGCGIKIDGTTFTDLKNTEILDNTVVDNDYIGADLVAAVGGTFDGNTLDENSRSSAGTYSNIRLISDGTTATSGWGFGGMNKSGGATYARSAFQLNNTAPVPSNLKVHGNKFDTCNLTDIELNGVVCAIDGYIRVQSSINTGVVANAASYSIPAGLAVAGSVSGDVIDVTTSGNIDGCYLGGNCSVNGTVDVTFMNLSGGNKTLNATIYLDIWKRQP